MKRECCSRNVGESKDLRAIGHGEVECMGVSNEVLILIFIELLTEQDRYAESLWGKLH